MSYLVTTSSFSPRLLILEARFELCSFCPLTFARLDSTPICIKHPISIESKRALCPSPKGSQGCRQVVRRWILVPVSAGSNPATSAKRQRLFAAYGVQAACPSWTLNLVSRCGAASFLPCQPTSWFGTRKETARSNLKRFSLTREPRFYSQTNGNRLFLPLAP